MPGNLSEAKSEHQESKTTDMANGGTRRPPFFIGVAGGTASGKSSVCEKIMESICQEHKRHVALISQDSFYVELTDEKRRAAERGEFNFDHPDAFQENRLLTTLLDLKSGKCVRIPKYDFKTHSKMNEVEVGPADVLLVEGILVLYYPQIRDIFNIKIFVDTDSDTRLSRRVLRDTMDLGRDLEQVLTQYEKLVKPAYEGFCLPTKKYADVIIPRGSDNETAIDFIVKHIESLLRSPRSSPDTHLNPIVGEGAFSRPH